MKNDMNVLSLFDGISAGRLALHRAGYKNLSYYASEIDPHAIAISKKRFDDTFHLGDVTKWDDWDLPKIDMLIGGSPCTGFSRAGKLKNFDDPQSKLFWVYVEILKELKPKYFLLENVVMKKEWIDVISKELGVEPIMIDSALLSAQRRRRLYWTNIPNIIQPEDKKIFLKDIVLSDVLPVALHNLYGGFKEKSVHVFEDKSPTLRTAAGGGHIPSFVKKEKEEQIITFSERRTEAAKEERRRIKERTGKDSTPRRMKEVVPRTEDKANTLTSSLGIENLVLTKKALAYMDRKVHDGRTHWEFKHHSDIRDEKSATIVANFFKGVPYNVFKDWDCIRKFHPVECERLQTFNTICDMRITLCLDQAKNYVYAVNKNPKLQKLVLNVEKNELKEFVTFVGENMKQNVQQIRCIVPQNADMHILKKIKKCTKTKQNESFSPANFVEKEKKQLYQSIKEDFVLGNVFTNIIVKKKTHSGKEGCHQKDKNLIIQENGKIQLNLYGKEILQFVKIVDMSMGKQEIEQCTYTTLYRLNTKNIEQMLIILYWFAKTAIDLSIQRKISIKNLLLKYKFEDSYTEFGDYDGEIKPVADTNRYKCLGNSWTVDVIAHIFRSMK